MRFGCAIRAPKRIANLWVIAASPELPLPDDPWPHPEEVNNARVPKANHWRMPHAWDDLNGRGHRSRGASLTM